MIRQQRQHQQLRRKRWREYLAIAAWIVFALVLLAGPFDWAPVRKALTFKPKIREAVAAPIINDDEIYTGSIYFVPASGDACWQRMIDNRNGRMWDMGYVDCYEAMPQDTQHLPRATMSGDRMLAIGKALRGQ
jgi:hypothetical protein